MLNNIKALILDMDGVIWKGSEAIGDLSNIFKDIKSKGLGVVFATNNSTLKLNQFVQKLDDFGVVVDENQIITSAIATANYLEAKIPPGSPINVIGEIGLISALESKAYIVSNENAKAVVVGLDTKLSYEKMKVATLIIRSGKPFYRQQTWPSSTLCCHPSRSACP